jgi:hypothetical protein
MTDYYRRGIEIQEKILNICMAEPDDVDDAVNSILTQLKQTPTVAKKVKEAFPDSNMEDLEKFVINHSRKLVEDAAESVEYVRDIVQSAPTPDDINALAELINATGNTLDMLNKMVIANKKLEMTLRIKEMDIASKRNELDAKISAVMTLTREEMMANLLNHVKTIETAPDIIEIEATSQGNAELSIERAKEAN